MLTRRHNQGRHFIAARGCYVVNESMLSMLLLLIGNSVHWNQFDIPATTQWKHWPFVVAINLVVAINHGTAQTTKLNDLHSLET